jgi:transposase
MDSQGNSNVKGGVKVSIRTIRRWAKQLRERGTFLTGKSGKPQNMYRSIKWPHFFFMMLLLQLSPKQTCNDLAELVATNFGIAVSEGMVQREFELRGVSFKKVTSVDKRFFQLDNLQYCAQFLDFRRGIPPHLIAFVDEFGYRPGQVGSVRTLTFL